MSNIDDYTVSYDAFMAIAEEEVKYPGMPVDVSLQESENLYLWCQEDKPLLIAAGITKRVSQPLQKQTQIEVLLCVRKRVPELRNPFSEID